MYGNLNGTEYIPCDHIKEKMELMGGYRRLAEGEIIEATDEYVSYHSKPGTYSPVVDSCVGKGLHAYNIPYYRRLIKKG
jgi:hypothetical protein